MADVLQYEFKHLDVSTAPGYDPVYHIQGDIANPQSAEFTFEMDETRQVKRSNTATIVCFGATGKYVRDWLIDNQYGSVNSICCRITDLECGTSRGEWVIKADGLRWCDDAECSFEVTMIQYSPLTTCLQNTLIFDNHRGWFPPDGFIVGNDGITGAPLGRYLHPRFRYCDDIRPQWLQNFLFVIAQGVLIAFNSIVGGIFVLVNTIDQISQFLFNQPFGLAQDFNQMISDIYTKVFGAFLGCNKLHPSPLVSTYFVNACSKCGITFRSESILELAEYQALAHMFAPVKKGVGIDSEQDFIWDNRPVFNAITYATALQPIFNAKFRLINGEFRFERRDFFDTTYLFDFTGSDRDYMIGGICWGWNGVEKPAFQSFHYEQDSFDTDGNMAGHRFNGVIEWNPNNNPLLRGEDAIVAQGFSSQRYTTDGIEKRLIFTVNGAIQQATKTHLEHLLLMDADITSTGKLIIWDNVNSEIERAETIRLVYQTWVANTGINYGDDYGQNHQFDYFVYNYHMYYAANGAYKTLADFHEIDNPNNFNLKNKEWTISMHWCCAIINKLITYNPLDGEITAAVDFLVKLNATEDGVIKKITVNYNTGEIKIIGTVK